MSETTENTSTPAKSIKEKLAAAKRPQRVVTINTNGALLAQQQELEMQLAEVKQRDVRLNGSGEAEARKIAEKIQAVEIEAEEALINLTLEALPSSVWRQRMAEHPPTDEQKAENYIVNLDELARNVLAESCIDPQLDQDDVDVIADLSEGQWRMVANALYQVNGGDNAVPFSRIASLHLPTSEDESKSPESGASRSAGSRAGSRGSGSRSKTATKRAGRLAG